MRLLIGILLMIAGFGVMFFFMLPLVFEGNETVYGWQAAVLCGAGEEFITDFTTGPGRRGGVQRGGLTYCVSPDGTLTEVTGTSALYALVGFLALFLTGLGVTMSAISRSVRRVVSSAAGDAGISINGDQLKKWMDSAGVSTGSNAAKLRIGDIMGSSKSLTEQLRDLQDAYDQRLISREEYEHLRQQIIDSSSRS